MVELKDLLGKTMKSVINVENKEIIFTPKEGPQYKLYHEQDCCEGVEIEDVIGDLEDLFGDPILMAEEVTNHPKPEPLEESYTWTFYKFATIRGYVSVRWCGRSNGYYSEEVSFVEVAKI